MLQEWQVKTKWISDMGPENMSIIYVLANRVVINTDMRTWRIL
jgi:hypothetical protein